MEKNADYVSICMFKWFYLGWQLIKNWFRAEILKSDPDLFLGLVFYSKI